MSFNDFIKNRFIKIYLPYILIILIEFLIPFIRQDNRVIALLSHIFLFKMFSAKYIECFGTPFWFMSSIISLYLVYILLYTIKIKINNNKAFIILSIFISFLWMLFVFLIGKSDERVYNSFFLQFLCEFSIGMVIAEYLSKNEKLSVGHFNLIVAMLIGLGVHGTLGILGFKVFNDFFR